MACPDRIEIVSLDHAQILKDQIKVTASAVHRIRLMAVDTPELDR